MTLQQHKEGYLATWYAVRKASRRVPEALATLPDNLPGAHLYYADWFIKEHFQMFRIDIPWRLDVLKALMHELEGNWQRRMSDLGARRTQAGYGLNENSGDFYMELQYRDTDISLIVCLSSEEENVVRYGRDMFFAPDEVEATGLFVEQQYCRLDAVWSEWWGADWWESFAIDDFSVRDMLLIERTLAERSTEIVDPSIHNPESVLLDQLKTELAKRDSSEFPVICNNSCSDDDDDDDDDEDSE